MEKIFAIIIVSLLGVFFGIKWLKLKRFQYRWRRNISLLQKMFADVNGIEISQRDREKLNQDTYGLVYGEIDFISFFLMLERVKPKPYEIFYDLGSGTGKAVFCSALFFSWKKCCGIELLPELYQTSTNKLTSFKGFTPIEFIHANILETDFLDANIIFVNATSFHKEFWQQISFKLNSLAIGTRIIVTSKQLNQSLYQLIDATWYWMSWGWCSVYIYHKVA